MCWKHCLYYCFVWQVFCPTPIFQTRSLRLRGCEDLHMTFYLLVIEIQFKFRSAVIWIPYSPLHRDKPSYCLEDMSTRYLYHVARDCCRGLSEWSGKIEPSVWNYCEKCDKACGSQLWPCMGTEGGFSSSEDLTPCLGNADGGRVPLHMWDGRGTFSAQDENDLGKTGNLELFDFSFRYSFSLCINTNPFTNLRNHPWLPSLSLSAGQRRRESND